MFKESLSRLVEQVEGAKASLLMGFDGIQVDSFHRGEEQFDIQTMGIEYSAVLSTIRRASELLEAGSLQEVVIRSEGLSALVRVVTQEYFVALALEPEGNIGKGRYLLRILSSVIRREIQ